MKVSVYKLPEGRIDIMVEAAMGNGKPPVVLRNVAKETLVERLLPVLVSQRGRRLEPLGSP